MTLFLYVLRLLSAAVFISAGGLFFIAIPPIVVSAVHTLGGVNLSALFQFLPIVLISMVPYMLPVGFLLSLVSTYGRLAADNEWTAINMAGVHPLKMMLPALVVAIGLGGISHYLSTEVSPGLSFQEKELKRNILLQTFRDVNPGRTEFAFGNFYLSAKSREPGTNVFRDVVIHLPERLREEPGEKGEKGEKRESQAGHTILADEAEFSFRGDIMRVDLVWLRSADPRHDVHVENSAFEIDIDELLETRAKNRSEWRFQSSRELSRMLDAGEVPKKYVRAAAYELHRRNAMTSTYFMFMLLGVPTGLLLRRGTQLGALAAAVGYALVYYLLSIRLGKTLTGWGTIPPAVGAWATPVLGCIAGALMCWRAFRR